MLNGVYAISDEVLTPYKNLSVMLQEACNAGIRCFQFRDKKHKDNEIQSLCEELQSQCQENNVIFILNDRVELAQKINANGLHIGKKEDKYPYAPEELRDIRKSFKGILGVSCYGSLELASQAKMLKADYIAFGACFSSKIKPNAKEIPLQLFQQIEGIARCAIGGINAQNVGQLQKVEMVACISGIWVGNISDNIYNLYKNWRKA
ncbi:thiamine phosphate synthase [Helicobacter mesocricetorum]|uniref:thiamine phosphate synthase n=1 Tax=Helicobacter mesocricetorum TaxID=87012 RepID=UPI000CF1AAFD|nr:thiamine phosphate synthase [Helicobacter mesocricetorum]